MPKINLHIIVRKLLTIKKIKNRIKKNKAKNVGNLKEKTFFLMLIWLIER